jgi:hypothetical protein
VTAPAEDFEVWSDQAGSSSGPKSRLVSIPLNQITPSYVNSQIYRPIDPNDPEIVAMAESIRKHGLREPIVVTTDHVIISGHRRYTACARLKLRSVPCRIELIHSTDERFEVLLRESNRQRVKTLPEIVRENLIDMNPDSAYQALLEERILATQVSGDFLVLGARRKRPKIGIVKMPMLKAIQDIVFSKKAYWPLSDREIHYDLLNDPPIMNTAIAGSRYQNLLACYKNLTKVLTQARLEGKIPFAAIADKTRTVITWNIHQHVGTFVGAQLDDFLKGYWRDLLQSQPNQIEIVGEKNTIEGTIRPVASKYCVPYTIGRGYASLDPRKRMADRFRQSGKHTLILLFLSDFDPEGHDIPDSFAKSMRDDFGITQIKVKKVCLTYKQVMERDFARTFDMKTKGSRYKKFIATYPDHPYGHELEAIPTEERAGLLEDAIKEVLDLDAYNRELHAERSDAAKLAALRAAVRPALKEAMVDWNDEEPQ